MSSELEGRNWAGADQLSVRFMQRGSDREQAGTEVYSDFARDERRDGWLGHYGEAVRRDVTQPEHDIGGLEDGSVVVWG